MSNMGGRRVLDLDWVENWARRVNEDMADATIAALGLHAALFLFLFLFLFLWSRVLPTH